jgi:L-fuconolactonase
LEPWATLIKRVAAHPNVYCKLSGMVTEADHKHWTIADLRPYVEHVVETFGWDRVMFGSDWPVCLLAARYEAVYDAVWTILAPHFTAERESRVFGLNALEFYRLEREDGSG